MERSKLIILLSIILPVTGFLSYTSSNAEFAPFEAVQNKAHTSLKGSFDKSRYNALSNFFGEKDADSFEFQSQYKM